MKLKITWFFVLIFSLININQIKGRVKKKKIPIVEKNDGQKLPVNITKEIKDNTEIKNFCNNEICPHCYRRDLNWYGYFFNFRKKYIEYLDSLKLRGEKMLKTSIITCEDICRTVFSKIMITKKIVDNIRDWAHN